MNISANGSDVCGESLMFFRCPIRNKGDIHSQYRRAKPRFVKCSGKTTLVSMHLNESRLASLPFRWQFLAFCYFIYTKVYRLDSTPWLYVVSLVFFFILSTLTSLFNIIGNTSPPPLDVGMTDITLQTQRRLGTDQWIPWLGHCSWS